MSTSTTLPILAGLVKLGDLKNYELKTVEEEPKSGMREHDQLILTFPSGRQLKIDTFCSGTMENCSIVIDNAGPPSK